MEIPFNLFVFSLYYRQDQCNFDGSAGGDCESCSSTSPAQCFVSNAESETKEFDTKWLIDSGSTRIIIGKPGKEANIIISEFDVEVNVSNTHGTQTGRFVRAITPLGEQGAIYLPNSQYNLIPPKKLADARCTVGCTWSAGGGGGFTITTENGDSLREGI